MRRQRHRGQIRPAAGGGGTWHGGWTSRGGWAWRGARLARTRRGTRLAVVGLAVAALALLAACGPSARLRVHDGVGPDPVLPPPEHSLIPTIKIAPAIGWPDGRTPVAGAGLVVQQYAEGLDHPRWLYVLPNGDVLVAETAAPESDAGGGIVAWFMNRIMERAGANVPSADRITLLRDTDADGVADLATPFLEGLYSPFGMTLVDDALYVANTDALVRFPYTAGATSIDAPGETIAELPAGPINYHWTKNVVASPDGSVLYVTVGSNSNIGENGMENEENRAAILEVDPDTHRVRLFASGLRNPNGLDFEPETGVLWTTVNERDELGSDLVPDYMTRVRDGDFYGWPYSYFGQHVDERVEPARPDLVAAALVPDYALGPHTASIGLAFVEADGGGGGLPARYGGGAFVGQHGSWNRDPLSGYRVIFVPFTDGEPDGLPEDVLTGFVSADGDAYGRPVGVALDAGGSLLVADDVGNKVWRVSAAGR